jgi:hypothetical protein
MTKKNDNVFGSFTGTAVGEAEVGKWEYAGIGYNASDGIFYVNEEKVGGLRLVPLALRQCKEVTDSFGAIHRYPVKTPKSQMIASDEVVYRLQVACVQDNEIFVFGARSWTARASWLNPRTGQWRDENFETGIWFLLEDHIKEMKSKHGVSTTPLCWEISLTTGKPLTVGTGRNTSKATPIVMDGLPAFVGPERVSEYEELFVSEDLSGWIAEWKKLATEKPAEDFETDETEMYEEPLPGDIPF